MSSKWDFEAFINDVDVPNEDQRVMLRNFLKDPLNLYVTRGAICGMSESDIEGIPNIARGTKAAFKEARNKELFGVAKISSSTGILI
jgi:hypothetical protein